MAGEQFNKTAYEENHDIGSHIKQVASDTTLKVYEQFVVLDDSDGNIALTLPPVSEAVGRIYTVYVATASNATTLQDQDDSIDWTGDFTIDANTDGIALFSDGRKWWVLQNLIA